VQASDSPVRKLRISTVRQLSLRFSLLFAVMIALFSAGIIVLLRFGVRQQQNRELISAARTIAEALKDGRVQEIDADLPYYITFSVYQSGTQEVIATNDPFLPILPVTPRRAERYTAKQYFIDGDLNILYYAVPVRAGGRLRYTDGVEYGFRYGGVHYLRCTEHPCCRYRPVAAAFVHRGVFYDKTYNAKRPRYDRCGKEH